MHLELVVLSALRSADLERRRVLVLLDRENHSAQQVFDRSVRAVFVCVCVCLCASVRLFSVLEAFSHGV